VKLHFATLCPKSEEICGRFDGDPRLRVLKLQICTNRHPKRERANALRRLARGRSLTLRVLNWRDRTVFFTRNTPTAQLQNRRAAVRK
jgi:hypothetical protein